MLEAILLISLGCSVLGLSWWNIIVHRSLHQIRAQHASHRAQSEAMIQGLSARLREIEQALDTPSQPPPDDTVGESLSEETTSETRVRELAAAGVDRKEIANRLQMRQADIELLFKLSAYREKASARGAGFELLERLHP